jgi:N-acetylmuramoyl-L-alanine amidase
MAYAIKSHRLQADGSSVPFRATPNKGGAIKPEVIVLHDTAGRIAVGSVVGSARSI